MPTCDTMVGDICAHRQTAQMCLKALSPLPVGAGVGEKAVV
jgi:hypothetical protein